MDEVYPAYVGEYPRAKSEIWKSGIFWLALVAFINEHLSVPYLHQHQYRSERNAKQGASPFLPDVRVVPV